MKKMNKKGFTLIELLAVIVILAIVAAVSMTVVVPMIGDRKEEAAISSVKNMVNQITGACQDTLTADIMAPAHGTFSGTVSGNGTLESCTTGTCTITFSVKWATTSELTTEKSLNFTAKLDYVQETTEFTGTPAHSDANNA